MILGALYPMNSWDFPTYGVAIAVALLSAPARPGTGSMQMAGDRDRRDRGLVAVLGKFVPFAGADSGNLTSIPGLRFIAKNVAGVWGRADLGRRVS